MCHAARYLAPGSLFLSLQQIREILEYKNVAQFPSPMLQARNRQGDAELRVLQRHLQLRGRAAHALGAPQQRFNILHNLWRKHVPKAGPDK